MEDWIVKAPVLIDPKAPVPFGTFRERATQIDVAKSYPKHMNISYAEADVIIRGVIKRALEGTTGVVDFKLPYNQGQVNCIRALRERDYGIALNIQRVRFDWRAGYIKIKLKEPMQWKDE